MQNLRLYEPKDIKMLEQSIPADEVLQIIGYRLDKVQKSPDKIKCFCPIHKEKIFRSLIIDLKKKTFRCSSLKCPGHRGGSLLDLYQQALEKGEQEVVEFWSKKVGIPVKPREGVQGETEEASPKQAPGTVSEYEIEDSFDFEDMTADVVEDVIEPIEPETEEIDVPEPLPEEAPVGADESDELFEDLTWETMEEEEEEEDTDLEVDLVEVPTPPEETSCAPSVAAPPKSVEQYVLDLNHQIAEGQLTEAGTQLEKALEEHENHPELLHVRVRFLTEQGQPDEAVEQLRQLLHYYRQRQIAQGCLRAAHELLERTQGDLEAYDGVVDAHLMQHNIPQAVRFLREAVKTCRGLDQPEEALSRLDRILELAPEDAPAQEEKIEIFRALDRNEEAVQNRIELARLYVRKDLIGKAAAALEEVLQADPNQIEAHQALIDLYLAKGQQQQAVSQMQQQAEVYLSSDQMDQALEVFEHVVRLEPKLTEARNRLAMLYRHAEKPEEAIEQYFQIARIYREKEMLGRAIRVYENILKQASDHEKARRQLIDLLIEKGDETAAVEQLVRMSEEFEKAGQAEEAAEGLRRALKLQPDNAELCRRMIEHHRKQGELEKALEPFEKLLSLVEKDGDEEKVRSICSEILEIDPAHNAAKAALARLDEARQAAEKPVAASVPALMARAQEMQEQNKYEEAIEALQSALILEPGQDQIWMDLASLFQSSGQENKAAETYLRLVQRMGAEGRVDAALGVIHAASDRLQDRVDFFRAQADLEMEAGASDKALLTYRRIVKIEPERPEHWLTMAALADEQRYEEEAEEAFRQAGLLFMEKSLFQQAEKCWRRALDVSPENTDIRLSLAETLEQTGDRQQALLERLQAVRILKSSEEISAAEKLLEKILDQDPEDRVGLEEWWSLVEGQADKIGKNLSRVLRLVSLYQAQGLVGKASRILSQLRQQLPEQSEVQRAQIEFYKETGAVKKAAGRLLELGQARLEEKNLDEALDCFLESESLLPDQPDSLLAQIEVYKARQDEEKEAELLLRLASQAGERGLVGKQIGYLENAWALQPGQISIGEQLAEIFLAKGDEPAAVEVLSRLIEHYRKQEDSESILKSYQKILAIQPDRVDVRFQLAEFFEKMADRQAALEQYQKIAALYSDKLLPADVSLRPVLEQTYKKLIEYTGEFSFRRRLGDFYRATGDFPAAQLVYHEALDHCPEAQLEQAVELCEQLLRVAPGESSVERRLVDLYRRAGRPKDAAAMLYTLWNRYLHSWETSHQESPLLEGAVVDRIEETAAQLIDVAPNDESVRQRMVDFYLAIERQDKAVEQLIALAEVSTEQGNKKQAAETYRKILSLEPGLEEVRTCLAEVLESMGQVGQAKEEYLQLGRFYLDQGRLEEARTSFQRVVDLAPEQTEALAALLEIARREKDVEAQASLLLKLARLGDQPLERYEEYLEMFPEDLAIRQAHFGMLIESGRFEEVLVQLDSLVEKFESEDQIDLARNLLDRAKEKFPNEVQLYEWSVRLLEKELKQAENENLSRPVILRLTRQLNDEQLACADLYRRENRVEEETRLLEKIVKSDPDADEGRIRLIEIYEQLGKKTKAGNLYQQLGELASRRGQLDEAEEAFAKALQLTPRSKKAKKKLDSLSAERGSIEDTVAEKRKMATEAARQERWEEAREAFEDILTLLPEDEESLHWLAEQYREEGQVNSAVEKADRLLQLAERRQDAESIYHWTAFLLEQEPDRLDLRQKQVGALQTLGRLEEAAEGLWKLAESAAKAGKSGVEQSACLRILDLGLDRDELNRDAALRLFDLGLERRAQSELEELASSIRQCGRPADAVEIFEILVERFPEHPSYRADLAGCLEEAGQKSRSLEQRLKLHTLYQRLNRPVEMVANLKAAIEASPRQAQVHQLLGRVFEELGNFRESVQSYLQAASLAQSEEDRLRAADCYRAVIRIDPQNLEAHQQFHQLQSGRALSDEEKEELLAVRRRLLQIYVKSGADSLPEVDRLASVIEADYPDDERALRMLAEAYQHLNRDRAVEIELQILEKIIGRENWETAEKQLKRIRLFSPLPFEHLRVLIRLSQATPLEALLAAERLSLAESLVAQQDREGAIEQYQALVSMEPNNIEYLESLIDNLDVAGHHKDSREVKFKLADLYRSQGRVEEAIQRIESALGYEKEDEECLRQLADLYTESGVPTRARPVLEQLAQLSEERGDLSAVQNCFERLSEIFPRDGSVREKLARVFEMRGDLDGAGQVRLDAARIHAAGDQVGRAIELYENLVREHPEQLGIRRSLIELLRQKGLHKEALEQDLAIIQWQLQHGRPDEALGEYQRLLDADPQNFTLLEDMAQLLLKEGRRQEAIESYLQLAEEFANREMLRRSQETLQHVLNLQPDHLEARRRLADIFIEKGLESDGQEQLLGWMRETLARTELKKAPLDEMEETAEKILKLNPDNREALQHLSKVLEPLRRENPDWGRSLWSRLNQKLFQHYLVRGLAEEAQACLDQIRQAEPNLSRLPELEEEIDRLRRFHLPQEEFEQNLRQASEFFEKGEYSSAAQLYEQLLRAEPNNVDLILRLSETYINQGQTGRAADLLESEGKSLLADRNLEGARRLLVHLNEMAPKRLSSQLLMAQLAMVSGNPDSAVEQYLVVADSADDPEQYPDLVQALERAREIAPQNENVLRRLAAAYLKTGRLEESRNVYRALADKYRQARQPAQAAQAIRSALDIDSGLTRETAAEAPRYQVNQKVSLLEELGGLLFESGNVAMAAESWLEAAELSLAGGEFEVAKSNYEKVLQLKQENVEPSLVSRAFEGLSELYTQQGNTEAAAETLSRLAHHHESRQQKEAALEALERAVALEPDSRRHLEGLAQFYQKVGREEDYIRTSLRLARVMQQLDLIGRAEAIYRTLLGLSRWSQTEKSPEEGEPSYVSVAEPLIGLCLDKGAGAEAVDLLADLSNRFESRGQQEEAIGHLERILQIDPDHLLSLEKLAKLHLDRDEKAPALQILDRLAGLLEQQGYSKRATELYLQILESDPERQSVQEGIHRLARIPGQRSIIKRMLQRRFDQAFIAKNGKFVRTIGRLLLEIDPRIGDVRIRIPEVLLWEEKENEAVEALLEQCRQFEKEQELLWARRCLIRSLEIQPGREDLQSAMKTLEEQLRAAAESQRIETVRQEIEEKLESSKPSLALLEIDNLLTRSPDDIPLLEWGAELFENAGRGEQPFSEEVPVEKRQQWLNRGLQIRLELARLFFSAEKFSQASRQVEQVLSVDPDFGDAGVLLMGIYEKSDQTDRLLEHGQALARRYRSRNELQLAVDTYRRLLEKMPQQTTLLGQLAATLMEMEQRPEAAQVYREQADQFFSQELYAQALSTYKKILSIFPNDLETLEKLTEVYIVRGDLRGALTYERRCLEIHLERNDFTAAESVIDRMIELHPTQTGLLREKADLLFRQGKRTEARKQLEALAQNYQEQELINKAIDTWQQILTVEPDHREVRQQLIQGFLQKGLTMEAARQYMQLARLWRDRDEGFAGECLRQAMELAPEEPEFMRPYAEFLVHGGRKTEAVETFQRLADCLEQQGMMLDAAGVYQQILRLDPDRLEAVKRLAGLHETMGRLDRAAVFLEQLAQMYEKQNLVDQAVETYLQVADYYYEAGVS